ncbi:MAG: hypothetical protein ABH831_01635 [Candidatus Nealsonbacteria bacterium]
MKKYFAAILMINIALVSLPLTALAEEAPQTMEEAGTLGMNILERLPSAMKDVWFNQVLPLWQNMWVWAKPKVQNLWEKLLALTGKEMPDIKEEFQKEKDEMQQDLWERFKGLF